MAGLVLEIVEGAGAGRQYPLDAAVEIGRDRRIALPLDDEHVSRRHARVTPEDGRAWVEDLGSTNGTFVNEEPIHAPRALVASDRVRVGVTVLELRSARQIAERPSAVRPAPLLPPVPEEVLEPVPDEQLAAVAPPPPPPPPAPPAPPRLLPAEVAGDEQARRDYAALQRLVDARVKQRQSVAAFALLASSVLAVILYFCLAG